jgi:hypothetical protein
MITCHCIAANKTWARLVTPTVKRALADAEQHLGDTNHTMSDFLAPARPEPLTTDELVNEPHPAHLGCNTRLNTPNNLLKPMVGMPLTWVCLRCRSSAGGDEAGKQKFSFISCFCQEGFVTNCSMGRAAAIADVPACPQNLFFFVSRCLSNAADKIKHLK